MRIRNPKPREATLVYELQKEVLADLALDLEGVKGQLQMFPEGTFIAEDKQDDGSWKPVGMLSSVLWTDDFAPDFGKIHGTYPHTHMSTGKVLFIHTIAVLEARRGKGVGTKLIGEALNLTALLQLDRVQIISDKPNLSLLEKLGFAIVRPLPEFIPYHQARFVQPMLLEIRLA